jgi:hypothetical protein
MTNRKVIIELDRDVAKFLDKAGEEAQSLMLRLSCGSNQKFSAEVSNAIDNWTKIRDAIKAASGRE